MDILALDILALDILAHTFLASSMAPMAHRDFLPHVMLVPTDILDPTDFIGAMDILDPTVLAMDMLTPFPFPISMGHRG
ncbi:hypothetical protein KSX_57660 [Ktedonospora formicarum]|uniref:Uncharacterized protein n=1 Tax=Ktedonospora formicarum TaxID=2778364 RepID=A0A8J3I5T6_9CHLR|nr:hypothetical protein KSX_57660 [Ktedonospora formicarum]